MNIIKSVESKMKAKLAGGSTVGWERNGRPQ